MFTAGLLGMAVLLGVSFTTMTSKNTSYDVHYAVAGQLAANIIEDLNVRHSYDALLTTATHVAYYDINQIYLGAPPSTFSNTIYTATWVVTRPTPNYISIVMTISWSDLGIPNQMSVQTMRGSDTSS